MDNFEHFGWMILAFDLATNEILYGLDVVSGTLEWHKFSASAAPRKRHLKCVVRAIA